MNLLKLQVVANRGGIATKIDNGPHHCLGSLERVENTEGKNLTQKPVIVAVDDSMGACGNFEALDVSLKA